MAAPRSAPNNVFFKISSKEPFPPAKPAANPIAAPLIAPLTLPAAMSATRVPFPSAVATAEPANTLANASQPPTAAPTSAPVRMSSKSPPCCAADIPPTIPPATMPSPTASSGVVRPNVAMEITTNATIATAARKMPQKLWPLGSM